MRQSWSIPRSTAGRLRAGALALAVAAALSGGRVAAQGTEAAPPTDYADGADALKPGQYLWTPDASPSGAMTIYVDLSRQLAAVYRGGVRIGLTTISSGREGYETPTGVFKIRAKNAVHYSNRYDNAAMPFTERLTDDGVALHAGRVPGYPESHGCVHLPYAFAKALFKETRVGMTVIMEGDTPARESASGRNSSPPAQVASASPSVSEPDPDLQPAPEALPGPAKP